MVKSATIFFFRNAKKMQNVLKRKNMYFDESAQCVIRSFSPVICFDYSGSFDMLIEKKTLIKKRPQKTAIRTGPQHILYY